MNHMVSIGKRAAGVAAAVAMIAIAGPVSLADAAPAPAPAPLASPAGPYQIGAAAAIGGWNAGAAAAVGGWNAGAAAMGLPFHFTLNTGGPFGLHTAGVAPIR
jgi:hypothetical protein